jgi:hypothetical protein
LSGSNDYALPNACVIVLLQNYWVYCTVELRCLTKIPIHREFISFQDLTFLHWLIFLRSMINLRTASRSELSYPL